MRALCRSLVPNVWVDIGQYAIISSKKEYLLCCVYWSLFSLVESQGDLLESEQKNMIGVDEKGKKQKIFKI